MRSISCLSDGLVDISFVWTLKSILYFEPCPVMKNKKSNNCLFTYNAICVLQVYRQGSPGSEDVYILLMKMLISPPDSEWLTLGTRMHPPASDLEMALNLLEQYAGKMHPVRALGVLPDQVPVGRIRQFLEVSLQNKLNERRKSQVLKGLLYAEHLQVNPSSFNKIRVKCLAFIVKLFIHILLPFSYLQRPP